MENMTSGRDKKKPFGDVINISNHKNQLGIILIVACGYFGIKARKTWSNSGRTGNIQLNVLAIIVDSQDEKSVGLIVLQFSFNTLNSEFKPKYRSFIFTFYHSKINKTSTTVRLGLFQLTIPFNNYYQIQ